MSRWLGIGLRAAAPLCALVEAAEAARACAPGPLAGVAVAAQKAGPAAEALAAALGLPLLRLPLPALHGQPTRTASPRILARFGTGSLAEAAALAAAGPRARLLVPRHISTDRTATAAIAEGERA